MRDVCPHAGARFSEGRVSGLVQGTHPDEPVGFCRKGEIITCPWHGWEFDLTTG
ncbi:Rieske 2Fe-2S domain-containing protein [Opitutia bacterium ISCC 51]|nr:Rieske 2Fe-2S domain-containing protein [Opitutae bacterium ISCC 51]QXD29182.1 Rieske 2Fe-2S domain-containing protein [Opitutae bacterium ISCC 52]